MAREEVVVVVERDRAGTSRRPLTAPDRLLGLAGGAMIVAAVVLLLASAFRSGGEATASLPTLELLAPSDDSAVERPIRLHFRAGSPLSIQPGGWGAGGYHLHAELSGIEAMPGRDDIQPLPDGTYRWTLAAPASGATTIRLFWSDAAHQPVAGGGTAAVTVTVD